MFSNYGATYSSQLTQHSLQYEKHLRKIGCLVGDINMVVGDVNMVVGGGRLSALGQAAVINFIWPDLNTKLHLRGPGCCVKVAVQTGLNSCKNHRTRTV